MGEHGWFDKRFMYEESFRTPLVMRLPGGARGDIVEMVQNIDYAPTFLELAGVPVPDDIQGVSLLPLLHKQVVIDNIELVRPEIYLETAADGKNNWDFGTSAQKVDVNEVLKPDNASLTPQKQELIRKAESKTANPAAAVLAGFAAKNVSIADGVVQYADAKTGKTTKVIINAFNLEEESMDDNITAAFDAGRRSAVSVRLECIRLRH